MSFGMTASNSEIANRKTVVRDAMIALSGLALATTLFAATAAQAQQAQQVDQRGAIYNCQNGAQMTVVFQRDGFGNITLRYVYDGPNSAMRTMRPVGHINNGNFVDGQNRINVLNNNAMTLSYVEGPDFFDRCTAFQTF
jgi:hypothetical protein